MAFEVKKGQAIIRAEHDCSRETARCVLANYAARFGTEDLLALEVETAIRETLRDMGANAYVEPPEMFAEDWKWVDKHLNKVWKDPQ